MTFSTDLEKQWAKLRESQENPIKQRSLEKEEQSWGVIPWLKIYY